MSRQSTMKDVAREAHVSIGTVDRVLHDRGRVSAVNKDAVLNAIGKLDYQTSQIARALVNRKKNIRIGITYPLVDSDFWSEIPRGIEAARKKLLPFGVELLIDYIETYDIRDQVESVDKLVASGVSGILLTSVDDSSAEQIEKHIPLEIPYATVVNPTAFVSRCAFHIGPDDFSLGNIIARLISLFCGEQCNIVILAPNYKFNGTQRRIAGILSKISQELRKLNILKVIQVSGVTAQDISTNVYNKAVEVIENFPSLDAIYVSDGFFEPAAFAVRDKRLGGVKVFGHEYTPTLPDLIKQGIVAATLYQKPANEWYQAIILLNDLLTNNRRIDPNDTRVECSILISETLSSANIGGIHLL